MTEIEATAKLIANTKKHSKPIAVCFMGGEKVASGRKILEEYEIPSYDFPERAVKALVALHEYHDFKAHNSSIKVERPRVQFDREKAGKIIRKSFSTSTQYITDGEMSAFDVFDAYGISTVKRVYGVNLSDLKAKSEYTGYPIVMKTCARGVLHKTDIGGVKVGLRSEAELQRAYSSIVSSVKKAGFTEDSDKVDIYKMEEDGIEIFLGAKKDANFGPLIIFGMGGIFVEALKDFSYRIAPVSHSEAKKMISEIKSQKMLNGYRGMLEVNRDKLADTIVGLSWLMLDFPEIKEIDINPIKATDKKCVAVDGKIILDV